MHQCLSEASSLYITPWFVDYRYINVIVFDVPNAFAPKYLAMRCNVCGFANSARVPCDLCILIVRYKVRLCNKPIARNIYNLVGCTNGIEILTTHDITHTEFQRRVRTLFPRSWDINTVNEKFTIYSNNK